MSLRSWRRILRMPTLGIVLLAVLSTYDAPLVVAQTSTLPTEGLKSTDAKTRAKTARELGQSGDSSVIPALVDALKDPDSKVRGEVVVALATLRQPAALDALTSDIGRTSNLRVKVEVTEAAKRLAPEQQLEVYRIAQEALSNIVKHANATNRSRKPSGIGRSKGQA